MKERPFIVSMTNHPIVEDPRIVIRALLDDMQTQMRMIIAPQPERLKDWSCEGVDGIRFQWMTVAEYLLDSPELLAHCPYGKPGDRLWVREAWADTNGEDGPMLSYRAGGDRFLVDESFPVDYSRYPGCQFSMWGGDLRRGTAGHRWRPARSMPRWATRIVLEITEVRVHQLRDITEEDARAQGMVAGKRQPVVVNGEFGETSFSNARDAFAYASGAWWWANPWMWALTFRRVVDVR